jgi:pilus assembly protein FimV
MIIKCEKCESEFNLDDGLLNKNGSTVRCSVCKNLFKVFPPEQDIFAETEDDEFSITAMEETVALDLPPDLDGIEPDAAEQNKEYSFDKAFEDAMEEVIEDDEIITSEDERHEERKEETSELQFEEDDEPGIIRNGTKTEGKGKSKRLLISLSVLLFLIVTFLIIFFFFPGILPDSLYSSSTSSKESVSDAGINQLNFKGVASSFSESGKAGQLFIIKGTVINNDQKSRSFILLKGDILDSNGKPLKEETAYAGNTLTEDQLKQISKEDIKAAMNNRSGVENSNVDVKPGASLPFMIIFSDLPDKTKMVDLTVEAVSSATGK